MPSILLAPKLVFGSCLNQCNSDGSDIPRERIRIADFLRDPVLDRVLDIASAHFVSFLPAGTWSVGFSAISKPRFRGLLSRRRFSVF